MMSIRRPTWREAWQGPLIVIVGVLLTCTVLAYFREEGVFADSDDRNRCCCTYEDQ